MKAHAGIKGNEKADEKAKAETALDPETSTITEGGEASVEGEQRNGEKGERDRNGQDNAMESESPT